MILSDKSILKMLREKSLTISPLNTVQIQPVSVDIRLGRTFSIVEDTPSGIINFCDEIKYKTIQSDAYLLLPQSICLGNDNGIL